MPGTTSLTPPGRRRGARAHRWAAPIAALALLGALAAPAAADDRPAPPDDRTGTQLAPVPLLAGPGAEVAQAPDQAAAPAPFALPTQYNVLAECYELAPFAMMWAEPVANAGYPDAQGRYYIGYGELSVNGTLAAAGELYADSLARAEFYADSVALYNGDQLEMRISAGGSSVTASATVSCSTQPSIDRYVLRVYQQLFSRVPDQAGMDYWWEELYYGTPREQVANSITYSDEFRSGLIRGSYRYFLGRDTDASGLAFWLGQMRAGATRSQMEAGFIASQEYYDRAGGTPTGWVKALYTNVLRRSPAPSEVSYWTGELAAGANRGQVALGFLLSTEHLNERVAGFYRQLLGRGIDVGGQAYWVRILQGGGREEAIIGGIVASDEYFNRV